MIKNRNHIIIQTTIFLLVLLWVYAAASKLIDFHQFQLQLKAQVLPASIKTSLAYLLPMVELGTAFLLIFPGHQLTGLCISAIILGLFIGYVGIVMTGFFGRIPCSCGGILSHLSWRVHLLFNCSYLLITIIAIILKTKET